ncbi:MAG TPA: penicillin-binding transpeptidase domain-containing protein [Vicinamibacterales bacterium]|nr:penicillin-binding transpeptidase domain-containing protein [Vicinamibacterales bacterium]
MKREQDQRWSALSRAALDPLQTDDRPSETFEMTWRRDYRRRLLTLGAVLAIWTAGIEARLAFLQVIRHPAYLARAKDQQNRIETLAPKRAEIVDRNGEVFAYSVDADAVVVNPRQVRDAEGSARALCDAFGDCTAKERADLTAKMKRSTAFEYLRRVVSPDRAVAVRDLKLPGVRVESQPRRYYPKRELAAQVVGFVNLDNKGLGGVELAFDSDISGKAGKVVRLNDGHQRSVDQLVLLEPTAGATLELTIDQTIQHIAERELKAGVLAQNAVSGTAVVMDPMTGEVLALANYPTYNPNAPNAVTAGERRNKAIEDIYEPGSTFKIVTAAAAIEEGVLATTDMIDTSPGHITVSQGRVVDDTHPHGLISFEDVIVLSSNVGAIKAGWKIGAERLNRYVHRFGFGEILSKDFKGATRGLVWPPEKLDLGALASVSMGYQIGVTPLQMVNAASAVANGGTLFQPHIVRAIIRDGKRKAIEPVAVRTAVSAPTAATLTTIMEAVVERGTGTAARVDGYQVAGKTGTAKKNDDGRYVDGAYTGSFVGFVPSRRPALAIIVVIDHPRNGPYYGGVVAAPVFQKIAAATLRHLAVPRTINPIAPVIISTDATLVARPVSSHPEVQPAALNIDGQQVMPSVTGLSTREAMRILSKAGLFVRVSGQGTVVTQAPEPGTPIKAGETCVLQTGRARPAPGPIGGGGS